MTFGFILATVGLALLAAGIQGRKVSDIFQGVTGDIPLVGNLSKSAPAGPSGPVGKGKVGGKTSGVSNAVIEFVGTLSSALGKPLEIGSGLRPGARTVNGNVSHHATGDAADIPLTGQALITAGQAALVLAGMNWREASRHRGGLFNVGEWQIIFNTYEGGDHTDHLHVGHRR